MSDKHKAWALECDDITRNQLMKVLRGEVTLVEGMTAVQIMAAAGVPLLTPAQSAVAEALVVAYMKGTLEERAALLLAVGCNDCIVATAPAVAVPAAVTVDTEFNVTATLYGGDHVVDEAVAGEAGCPTVKHVIRAEHPTDATKTVVLDTIDLVVLDETEEDDYPVTITDAQSTALGDPATVKIFVRSYTCGDLHYTETSDTATLNQS